MIIQKLLPGVLKELLTHVPTILFKVINWEEIASEIPLVTKKILKRDGFINFLQLQNEHLSPLNILIKNSSQKNSQITFSEYEGDLVLEIYFAQLFSPHGLFLDLRAQHFELQNHQLSWYPTGLWIKFEEKFRQGLIKVYSGFYLQNDEVYLQGLREIGMIDENWGEKDKNHLATLFKSHFGNALEEKMKFNLDHFKDSIFKVSHFMLEKKIHISKDFLYLGIYLVTLYDHLEKTNSPHPVKAIFLKTLSTYN
jgi:hypothetical protein